MDEKYFKDKISGYFDGDLKPEEMAMMTEWLKNSPEGQQALAELGRLDEFVRRQSELSGSEDFWERQAQKIEARLGFESAAEDKIADIQPRKSSGLGWKLIATAASIVLLIYVGVNKDDIFGPDRAGVVQPVEEQSADAEAPDEQFKRIGDTARFRDDAASADRMESSVPKKEQPAVADEMRSNEAAIPSPTPEREAVAQSGRAAAAPATTERQAEPENLAAEQDQRRTQPSSMQHGTPDIGVSTAEVPAPSLVEAQTQAPLLTKPSPDDRLDNDTMLTVWRQTYARTDSVLNTTAKDKTALQIPDMSTGLTRKAAPAATTAPKVDRTAVEAEMLGACFKIAELSPDSTEQALMQARLKAVAADSKSANRTLAQDYLDRLTTRK